MPTTARRSKTIFALAAVALVLTGALAFFAYDSLPGSVRRIQTPDGEVVKGTGTFKYHYATGQLKLTEEFRRGSAVLSRWYKPDGTLIAETKWGRNSTGTGYYLREGGSIKSRLTYVNGLADGTASYFNPDGSLAGEAKFEKGQRVSGFAPPLGF